jgi:uncharacterized protein YukE
MANAAYGGASGGSGGGFVSGADLGYSKTGIESLLQDIKANVIEKASGELGDKKKSLDNAIDIIWNGQSADTFKTNMQNDVGIIQKALTDLYAALESEVNQVGQEVGRIDEKLVEERNAAGK